jgi:xanthine/uracil/vitamin C permease (AzgA family)
MAMLELSLNSAFNRTEISTSLEVDDCARYITIFEYIENIEFDQIGTAGIDFHLSVADRGRNNTFGKRAFSSSFFVKTLYCTTHSVMYTSSWRILGIRSSSKIRNSCRTGLASTS